MHQLIYLARHGETAWTLSGQHTGRTDLPLTTNGRLEAFQLSKILHPHSFDAVYTSPLLRAKETAAIAYPEKEAILNRELLEWDYGNYEGKTSKEIHSQNPKWDLFQDGAPGGESIQDVTLRAQLFLKELEGKEGKFLVFSSGHILRVIITQWLGLPANQGKLFFLETGSLTVIGFEHDKHVLISSNKT